MLSYVPVCELKADSRSSSDVVSFEGDVKKTWGDFVQDVSSVRTFLDASGCKSWILHCENTYFFAVSLIALLQGGYKALVSANRQVEFIREIKKAESGFLTDAPFDGAVLVQDLLKDPSSEIKFNSFDKNKAEMVMFTSGTTGEPKSVYKLFCQFENELFELVRAFGRDFEGREVFSTVNHHHIYGLLFTALLPLATNLPFYSRRIDYPNEMSGLVNRFAMVASSPAYLKRLAADVSSQIPFEKTPLFFSSGGPLPEEVARKVDSVVGFWTIEVYGSTETGGIAYRQSKNGPAWTPFEVCRMDEAENGCLRVRSNYILEPEGFVTGDLVSFMDDGRFLLKGRADSIVKIEEKRISLPEVEMRLKSTGLVQDVRVVPMSGKRQYLAAAIVLNKEGVAKFANSEKLEINKFFHSYLLKFIENTVSPKKWRYLEELPQDTQGKIRTRDIQALFQIQENSNFHIVKMQREQGSFDVKMFFPKNSIYYDGHFPEFKLLPAVVQVDVAIVLSNILLGTTKNLKKILRTKFMKPIFPERKVCLSVSFDKEKNRITFSYVSEEGETLSSGAFVMDAC